MPTIISQEAKKQISYVSLLPRYTAFVEETIPRMGNNPGDARLTQNLAGESYINWGYKYDGPKKGCWAVFNFCYYPLTNPEEIRGGEKVVAKVNFVKKIIMHPDGRTDEYILIELREIKGRKFPDHEIVIGCEGVLKPYFQAKSTRGCRVAVRKKQQPLAATSLGTKHDTAMAAALLGVGMVEGRQVA